MSDCHIMLDLETFSSAHDAAIVAIGAVRFYPKEDGLGTAKQLGATFYRTISAKSAQARGGRIDGDTVIWWLGQSEAARNAIIVDPVLVESALKDLSIWIREVPVNGIWGNGADFDNVIISNAYKSINWTQPWSYSLNRCYRTIKNLAPEIKMERIGEAHNALDDAISQASHLCKIVKELGIEI